MHASTPVLPGLTSLNSRAGRRVWPRRATVSAPSRRAGAQCRLEAGRGVAGNGRRPAPDPARRDAGGEHVRTTVRWYDRTTPGWSAATELFTADGWRELSSGWGATCAPTCRYRRPDRGVRGRRQSAVDPGRRRSPRVRGAGSRRAGWLSAPVAAPGPPPSPRAAARPPRSRRRPLGPTVDARSARRRTPRRPPLPAGGPTRRRPPRSVQESGAVREAVEEHAEAGPIGRLPAAALRGPDLRRRARPVHRRADPDARGGEGAGHVLHDRRARRRAPRPGPPGRARPASRSAATPTAIPI